MKSDAMERAGGAGVHHNDIEAAQARALVAGPAWYEVRFVWRP